MSLGLIKLAPIAGCGKRMIPAACAEVAAESAQPCAYPWTDENDVEKSAVCVVHRNRFGIHLGLQPAQDEGLCSPCRRGREMLEAMRGRGDVQQGRGRMPGPGLGHQATVVPQGVFLAHDE